MVVRTLGAGTLTRLMAAEVREAPDLSWLLFGPTDPRVVEPVELYDLPLAAE